MVVGSGIVFFGTNECGMRTVAADLARSSHGRLVTAKQVIDGLVHLPDGSALVREARALLGARRSLPDELLASIAVAQAYGVAHKGYFDPAHDTLFFAGVPYSRAGLAVIDRDVQLEAAVAFSPLPVDEQFSRRWKRDGSPSRNAAVVRAGMQRQNDKIEAERHGFLSYCEARGIPVLSLDSRVPDRLKYRTVNSFMHAVYRKRT